MKGLANINPDYIDKWDMTDWKTQASFILKILHSAVESKWQHRINTSKSPDQLCNIVLQQLFFASEFGIFLWATGVSHQTIDACHHCGLSPCYQSVLDSVKSLGDGCMDIVRSITDGPHIFSYDNVNMSTSNFIEQRGSHTLSKVTSGTLGIVYKIPNAHLEDVLLAPILARMRDASLHGLRFERIAEFCPLRVSTTEEASIHGNLLYHDEIYLNLLRKTSENISLYAIRLIFQIGIGLFHLCLNLCWALLSIYHGTTEQKGSLQYFFALLGKSRLSGEKPDYHTLLAAFMQILDGLTLNGLQTLCEHEGSTLASFLNSNPSPMDLLQKAMDILYEFATPLPQHFPAETIDEDDGIQELTMAIRDGDFGRIKDILPQLAMTFRAASGNNYCTEILHLIINLKYVWTPVFV
ncbi:hypothetical protein BDQ17DRAFT_1393759 [Cyathus striatus]|nr:hypothetical protein BDQ17DRAFT_1393759 [Cyathus striatus]